MNVCKIYPQGYCKGVYNAIKVTLETRNKYPNEKIYILKDILIKIYRDYEITTGIIDEPYFIRAEKKIKRIIREKKVDYYYNLLKKFRSY